MARMSGTQWNAFVKHTLDLGYDVGAMAETMHNFGEYIEDLRVDGDTPATADEIERSQEFQDVQAAFVGVERFYRKFSKAIEEW